MTRTVPFIPKRQAGDEPWTAFGADKAAFDFWIPHMCGPIGIAMAAAAFARPISTTMYELLLKCLDLGVFKLCADGFVAGAFHAPLLNLALQLGLEGEVVGNLSTLQVKASLKRARMALLSIDLMRAAGVPGSHLVLVHSLSSDESELCLHDCAAVLGVPGADVPVLTTELDRISNKKGLLLWKVEVAAPSSA